MRPEANRIWKVKHTKLIAERSGQAVDAVSREQSGAGVNRELEKMMRRGEEMNETISNAAKYEVRDINQRRRTSGGAEVLSESIHDIVVSLNQRITGFVPGFPWLCSGGGAEEGMESVLNQPSSGVIEISPNSGNKWRPLRLTNGPSHSAPMKKNGKIVKKYCETVSWSDEITTRLPVERQRRAAQLKRWKRFNATANEHACPAMAN